MDEDKSDNDDFSRFTNLDDREHRRSTKSMKGPKVEENSFCEGGSEINEMYMIDEISVNSEDSEELHWKQELEKVLHVDNSKAKYLDPSPPFVNKYASKTNVQTLSIQGNERQWKDEVNKSQLKVFNLIKYFYNSLQEKEKLIDLGTDQDMTNEKESRVQGEQVDYLIKEFFAMTEVLM
jgi:hypothetical protein